MAVEHWIWLQTVLGYNSSCIHKIIDDFGSAEEFYAVASASKTKLPLSSHAIKRLHETSLDNALQILKECEQSGIEVIPFSSDKYPKRLKGLASAPTVLYVKGELPDIDNECGVTVVGPRQPSAYGMKAAFSLSFKLAGAGCLIISGGAIGVDACAHHGALQANCKTVAVLGAGLNINYPRQNEEMRREILEKGGALVSEYIPNMTPSPKTFPQRNRILSALSCGTVVIEAALGSGSLVTANLASAQGRDLFVLPGVAGNSMFEGSNKLLKEGAVAVDGPSDILEPYSKLFKSKVSPTPNKDLSCSIEDFNRRCLSGGIRLPSVKESTKQNCAAPKKDPELVKSLSDAAKRIYLSVNEQPFTTDKAVVCSGLDPNEVIPALTELEIFGIITAVPGGRYRFI